MDYLIFLLSGFSKKKKILISDESMLGKRKNNIYTVMQISFSRVGVQNLQPWPKQMPIIITFHFVRGFKFNFWWELICTNSIFWWELICTILHKLCILWIWLKREKKKISILRKYLLTQVDFLGKNAFIDESKRHCFCVRRYLYCRL